MANNDSVLSQWQNQVNQQSMQYKCECEFCRSGKATTHNDPSHDQRLYLKWEFNKISDAACEMIEIVGGTTKCARVMGKFIEQNGHFGRGFFEHKRVMEVGSGTGLVGIIAGFVGADVVLTDQAPVLELLQENLERNLGKVKEENRNLVGKFSVEELYWGEENLPLPLRNKVFDVIIGSDLIFAKENIPLLVTTFSNLCSPDNNSEILFAHIDRFSWEETFFSMMKSKGFSFEIIYTEDEIKIFKFVRLTY